MTDKFTQLSDARAEFARLWDKSLDEIAESDKSWRAHWKAHREAGDRVLALMGYTDTVPPHYQGCLPSSHQFYLAYTLEELP